MSELQTMTDDADDRSLIIVEDESLRPGFTQIPNAVLRRADITPGAKVAFMVLLSYAWGVDSCFPGQERMSLDMGVSKQSVITYLKQLQQLELISIKRRGQGKPNIYTIHRLRSQNSVLQEVKNSTPLEVKNLDPKNTQRKDPKKKTKTSNFEGDFEVSNAPARFEKAKSVTPAFKTAHPSLFHAGCNGVAAFIRVVGRGLWADEATNVARWTAAAGEKQQA